MGQFVGNLHDLFKFEDYKEKKCSFPIELMDFAMEDNSLFFRTLFSWRR